MERPNVFHPQLAGSLCNFSNYLAAVGRSKKAFDAAGAALAIYGILATRRPSVFAEQFAMALCVMSNRYLEMGVQEKAIGFHLEALRTLMSVFRERSTALASRMAHLRQNYIEKCSYFRVPFDRGLLETIDEMLRNACVSRTLKGV